MIPTFRAKVFTRTNKFPPEYADCGFVYGTYHEAYNGSLLQMITTIEEMETKTYDIYTPTLGMFTGFKDCDGKDIYEGDILVDIDVELEKGVKRSDVGQQVFWSKKYGCWKIDNSFEQNKSSGYLLANELKDYRFKVIGTIHD